MPHDLAVIPPDAPTDLQCIADAEMRAALGFAEAQKAPSTRRCYAADWRCFTRWCVARGLEPLPATAATVARFIASEAARGLKPSSLGRRIAALSHAHKLAGYDQPATGAETVRAVLAGIRRTVGALPLRKTPLTGDVIERMMAACPETTIGLRDRALLAFGFSAALRRSELVALRVEDIETVADGLRLTIRKSKTDQEGYGAVLAIPHGYHVRPVAALQRWIEVSGIVSGPIFRHVKKGGLVQDAAISGHSASSVVKRRAAALGLSPAEFGGHSLRSGYATSAAEKGASLIRLADHTRHKSLEVLRIYIRSADLFKNHSGEGVI